MTQNDKGHGPGWNYGETAVFMSGQKVFLLGQKCVFSSKTPKFAKRLIFILEKVTYFFCHLNLNFVNGPFVALKETVHFQPWERFLDFSIPSYGCFHKKNVWCAKKSSPTPLWGRAPSASNSRSAGWITRPSVLYVTHKKVCPFQIFRRKRNGNLFQPARPLARGGFGNWNPKAKKNVLFVL